MRQEGNYSAVFLVKLNTELLLITKKYFVPEQCHANFGGHYTAGNYLIECDKCNQDPKCKEAKKSPHNIINIKCNCLSGKCEAHYENRHGSFKYEC